SGILGPALGLRASLPGLDSEAVATAAQKLRLAAGENLRTAVDVSPIDADEERLTALNEAIDDEAALTIDYCVGSRAELTTRTLAPTRLVPGSGWSVDAWCYSAGGQRRVARGRTRCWQPAQQPPLSGHGAASRSREVTLGLSAAGAWLADELAVIEREYFDSGDTSVRIRLLVHSVDWLSRFLLCHADVITDIDDTEAVGAALRRLG